MTEEQAPAEAKGVRCERRMARPDGGCRWIFEREEDQESR